MIKAADLLRDPGPRLDTLGRVAAGIAHELATPIQFVEHNLAFVEQALEPLTTPEPLPGTGDRASLDEALQALREAREGARAAIGILAAMRSLHHPGQMSPVEVDLNRELEAPLLLSRHRVSKVATLQDDRSPLPPVACHPGLLNQVVLNLLLNAADAIEESGTMGTPLPGTIRLSTRLVGSEVEIAVEDSGRGIPQPLADRIFDPFFTTKGRLRGTGQGLAIAREIVETLHGGCLGFTPNPGKGVTFRARIPLGTAGAKEGIA